MYIDLLTRIKNAQAVGKESLVTPYSRMDNAVAELLQKKGFLKKVETKGRVPKKVLKLYLNTEHVIHGVKVLSKPSLKQSGGYRRLKNVKRGHGLLVLSTPKGILSGERAKKEKVGGQLLFEIW